MEESNKEFELDKYYTLGLITNQLIHKINNSIQGMLLLVNFLKMIYPTEENVSNLEDEIRGIKDLTHLISNFIKMNHTEFGPVDLSILINKTITLLRDLTSAPLFMNLEIEYPSSVLWTQGSFPYLQQAFLHLFLLCQSLLKNHDPSTIKVKINNNSCSKKHVVGLCYNGLSLICSKADLKEDADFRLGVVERIIHSHGGECHFLNEHEAEHIFMITLPAFYPSSGSSGSCD